jgi:hypothetical protein
MQLTHLRAAWVNGVVDSCTLVWGLGLEGWWPIRNVEGLIVNIRTLDGAQFCSLVLCAGRLEEHLNSRPRRK